MASVAPHHRSFKAGGAGYQRRMKAVLRAFMRDRKKKERA
jgi:hypothetical protein